MNVGTELLGIGLGPEEMTMLQICLRAVLIFFVGLVIVRLANRRFLARLTPLDVILGFILASLLARAINGSGPLLESIAAAFVLILLHRILAALCYRWDFLGRIVKGKPDVLVEEGRISRTALRAHNLSENDLIEAVRIGGGVEDLTKVSKVFLERDGNISVVKRNR